MKTIKNAGFTLIEALVVAGIIGAIGLYLAKNVIGKDTAAKANICKGNLSEILQAKQQYAYDNSLTSSNAAPSSVQLGTQFPGGSVPICPDAGTYDLGTTIDSKPTCSKAGHSL